MKRVSKALCQLFNLPFLLHPSHCWLSIHLQTLFLKQRISKPVFQLRVPGPLEVGASPSQMNKCCSLLETFSTLQSADTSLMKRRGWKMQTAIRNQTSAVLQGANSPRISVSAVELDLLLSLLGCSSAVLQSEPQALGHPLYQGLGITREEGEKPYRDHPAAALVPQGKSNTPAHLQRQICSYRLGAQGATSPCERRNSALPILYQARKCRKAGKEEIILLMDLDSNYDPGP